MICTDMHSPWSVRQVDRKKREGKNLRGNNTTSGTLRVPMSQDPSCGHRSYYQKRQWMSQTIWSDSLRKMRDKQIGETGQIVTRLHEHQSAIKRLTLKAPLLFILHPSYEWSLVLRKQFSQLTHWSGLSSLVGGEISRGRTHHNTIKTNQRSALPWTAHTTVDRSIHIARAPTEALGVDLVHGEGQKMTNHSLRDTRQPDLN